MGSSSSSEIYVIIPAISANITPNAAPPNYERNVKKPANAPTGSAMPESELYQNAFARLPVA